MSFCGKMLVLPREYQQKIAESILEKGNSLVVLPTGMGKTLIGVLVAEKFLKDGKKAIFLAPTRPLVYQHAKRIEEYLGIKPIEITGKISSIKRKELYKSQLVISTPQGLSNDLKKWNVMDGFSVVVFDECHRCVGKYAYTHIANVANEKGILLVGLTASPGGKVERIKEIMNQLHIRNIEIRTEREEDMAKYIQPLKIEWKYTYLPEEIKKACEILNEILDEKIEVLKQFGIRISKTTSRNRLSKIYIALSQHKNLAALAHFASFYSAFHGTELLQTEGPVTYKKFVERLKERKKRVDWRLIKAANETEGVEHPKMELLMNLLKEREGKKTIVFAQYRDQVKHIVEVLNKNGFDAKVFLGKKEGGEEEQRKTLDAFSNDEFKILVATSIGEEGIDVPQADVAVFYEPVPSEIRTIQRRGRVGRLKEGEVLILVTKGTLDETFKWVSIARERKMHKIVKGLTKEKGQQKLGDFA